VIDEIAITKSEATTSTASAYCTAFVSTKAIQNANANANQPATNELQHKSGLTTSPYFMLTFCKGLNNTKTKIHEAGIANVPEAIFLQRGNTEGTLQAGIITATRTANINSGTRYSIRVSPLSLFLDAV